MSYSTHGGEGDIGLKEHNVVLLDGFQVFLNFNFSKLPPTPTPCMYVCVCVPFKSTTFMCLGKCGKLRPCVFLKDKYKTEAHVRLHISPFQFSKMQTTVSLFYLKYMTHHEYHATS